MLYFMLIVASIIYTLLLYSHYQHREEKSALAGGIAVVIAMLAAFSLGGCDEYLKTRDTEYWGGYYTHVCYEEPWDEEVPCRHPVYCTRSYIDSQGRTQTESYVCGFEHLYDVDYHPPEWYAYDNNGKYRYIEKSYFEELAGKWNNKKFVDMHRSYHSIDGDKYESYWDNTNENIVTVFYEKTYKNKVQASSNVVGFRELSKEEIAEYSLFEYPATHYEDVDFILGGGDTSEQKRLKLLNAKLGRSNQVCVWILIFKEQPHEAALLQREYWKGGNKNELVICIGQDKSGAVSWSHVFSWSEAEEFKIRVRDRIAKSAGKILSLTDFIGSLETDIPEHWQRKRFRDFDYLRIDRPLWISYISFVLLFIAQPVAYHILVNQPA